MKQQEANSIIKDLNVVRENILFERNKQYSVDDNYVANFKDVSTVANVLGIHISSSEVAMVLAILKMVRDSNAKRSGQTLDERKDHKIDLHNYLDLAHLCEVEDWQPNEEETLRVAEAKEYFGKVEGIINQEISHSIRMADVL